MTKKTTLLILFIFTCSYSILAQNVGINIDETLKTLDVLGDLTVRKALRVGQTEVEEGDAGLPGEALTSRGPGKSPVWRAIDQPVTTYKMKESFVLIDSVGIIYTDPVAIETVSELPEYSKIEDLPWSEIVGLKSTITPTKADNRVIFTMQSVAQEQTSANIYFSYYVGLFIDGELRSVRCLDLLGNSNVFKSMILYDSFQNLVMKPGNKPYTLQVAVMPRFRFTPQVTTLLPDHWINYFGAHSGGADPSNTNKWMNRTSLKVELYENIFE